MKPPSGVLPNGRLSKNVPPPPSGKRVIGSLARTILRCLDWVDKHPEDPNSPKYIVEARGFCKEHGLKLQSIKGTGPSRIPPWIMKPRPEEGEASDEPEPPANAEALG